MSLKPVTVKEKKPAINKQEKETSPIKYDNLPKKLGKKKRMTSDSGMMYS